MIDIQWKGKIGYGDIISPICYAHNVSFKLQTQVNLTFRWEHGPEDKTYPIDREMLWKRADVLNRCCDKAHTNVQVFHSFNNPLDINHTNYDWDVVAKDSFHNYWRPQPLIQHKPSESNIIVVNSTATNVKSLKNYGKEWKDPLVGQWETIIDVLSHKYEVRVVDYRTPIKKLINLLQIAKGFIGYHGACAVPAKFIHTPSIIFADGGSLTRNAFHYAHIEKNDDNLIEIIGNPELYFEKSQVRINQAKKAYKSYKLSEKFEQSLTHEV